MNRWRIPKWFADEVRQRKEDCVYCRTRLLSTLGPSEPRKSKPTWEHIVNDAHIVTRENIGLAVPGETRARALAHYLNGSNPNTVVGERSLQSRWPTSLNEPSRIQPRTLFPVETPSNDS